MSTTASSVRFAAALTHASNHRAELTRSESCGCFACFRRFVVTDITAWIDKNETALCPRCGLDSVIGAASGIKLDDRFLRGLAQFNAGAGTARAR